MKATPKVAATATSQAAATATISKAIIIKQNTLRNTFAHIFNFNWLKLKLQAGKTDTERYREWAEGEGSEAEGRLRRLRRSEAFGRWSSPLNPLEFIDFTRGT